MHGRREREAVVDSRVKSRLARDKLTLDVNETVICSLNVRAWRPRQKGRPKKAKVGAVPTEMPIFCVHVETASIYSKSKVPEQSVRESSGR